jgi:bacterioferritin-associated ferredoxin
MYEHQYVWIKHNGPIPDGYRIHHINGIQNDNRIENLMLVTNSEHRKLHSNDWKVNRDDSGTRTCYVCKQVKLINEFHGVSKICASCQRQHGREVYRRKSDSKLSKNILDGAPKYIISPTGETLVRCAICKEYKSLESFPKNRSMKLGVGSYCKKCQREYMQNYSKKAQH